MSDFWYWIGTTGVVVLVAAYLAAYVYSLWELAFQRDDLFPTARVLWVILILWLNILGLAAYIILARRRQPPVAPA